MSQYKRHYQPGGNYFFTIVTHQRKPILASDKNIELLKLAIKKVKQDYPFSLNALVVLPDHLHLLLKLPAHNQDFSTRLRLIKRYFSMEISTSINNRKEKEVWQRRFWEHTISDEEDWRKHMDYIHYNPVKHGYVTQARDWKYSSFHQWVIKDFYNNNWGVSEPKVIANMFVE